MKVSIDFDGTLSLDFVQLYAQHLMLRGIEVWIVTSRLNDENAPNEDWNTDLYRVAKKLKIPKEHIIFTNSELKFNYLKDKNFIWHLDNDVKELTPINNHTDVKGIYVLDKKTWLGTCERLLTK